MRIVFISPVVSQTGGSRVIAIYARKLLEMGHDVTVISRKPEVPSLKRRLYEIARGRRRLRPDPRRTVYFDDLAERHVQVDRRGPLLPEDVPDADVIIATWWRTAFEVATMPPEKGVKVYFVQGHEVFPGLPWDISAGSYYLPLKKITISQWLVDTMAEVYGDRDVPKVPNSVDTRQFAAPPRARNGRPTVGLMYSTAPFKGVGVSLRAIEIARQTFPDLRIVSFGTHSPTSELPLPKGSSFRRSPPQDEIRNIYASCDVWLVASRSEGFGLPLLEAMACRTPVVASRAGAAEDLIEDGVNGYVVEVDDPEGLGRRLIDVLSLSNDDWRAMSDAAHNRAHAYTWNDAASAFEAELQRLRQSSGNRSVTE